MDTKQTVRRYGADRYDHAIEKNHGPVARESAAIAAAQPVAGESFIGGSYMECCGEFRCVCVCPGCGEKSITGIECEPCRYPEPDSERVCGTVLGW